MKKENKRILKPFELCEELEARLNFLYNGFRITYNEKEKTVDWKNQDIHLHFDGYCYGRLFKDIQQPKSLLFFLIRNLYQANHFKEITRMVSQKATSLTKQRIPVNFVPLAEYNASYVTPSTHFYFCPIRLFHNYKRKTKFIQDLTEEEAVSTIFSHEYGHFLYDQEHNIVETKRNLSNELKSIPQVEEVLIEKIKSHTFQQEKDAWRRGEPLAFELGVREEVYRSYSETHLEFLELKNKWDFKHNLSPYFKWKFKKQLCNT